MFTATIKPNHESSITAEEAKAALEQAISNLYPQHADDFTVDIVDDHIVCRYIGTEIDEDEFTDLCTPDEEWYLDDVSC